MVIRGIRSRGVRSVLVMGVALGVIAAFAGGAGAGSSKTIKTTGDESFVPNAKVMATLKFAPGQATVQSGDELTWQHGDKTEAPHTVSIVDAADVPDSIEAVFECQVCNEIGEAHFGPGFGGPFTPVVNEGAAGFDQPGDSVFFEPGGGFTMTISATSGSTLSYVCAIHPWMQGTIKVL